MFHKLNSTWHHNNFCVKPIPIENHKLEDQSLLGSLRTSNLLIPPLPLPSPCNVSNTVPLTLAQKEPSNGLQLVIHEFMLNAVGFPQRRRIHFYGHIGMSSSFLRSALLNLNITGKNTVRAIETGLDIKQGCLQAHATMISY